MRRIGILLLTCLIIAKAVFCLNAAAEEKSSAIPAVGPDEDIMEITAIDLGAENAGEATMISDANGSSILIDTGDTHNDAVFEWLDKNGYKDRQFDVLVTHWHDDHVGNAAKIVSRYKVGKIYIPPVDYIYSDDTDYYRYERSYLRKIADAAIKRGTEIIYLRKGQEITVGTVEGKVLYCCESPKEENGYPVQYINNQSAVTMFTGGGCRFLAGGDIQTEAEDRILKSGMDIRADIFKLSHHGLSASNSEEFLKKIDPELSYFTSNTATPYSMLSKDVEESVSKAKTVSDVMSTRYNGTIRFTCSGGRISVLAERNGGNMAYSAKACTRSGWPSDISSGGTEWFDNRFCSAENSVTVSEKRGAAYIFGFYKTINDTPAEEYADRISDVDWMVKHADYTNVSVRHIKMAFVAGMREKMRVICVSYDYRETTVYIYHCFRQEGKDLMCAVLDCTAPKGDISPLKDEEIPDVLDGLCIR